MSIAKGLQYDRRKYNIDDDDDLWSVIWYH